MRRLSRRLVQVLTVLMLGWMLLNVGSRALYFAMPGGPADPAIGALMRFVMSWHLGLMMVLSFEVALVGTGLLALLVRPRWFFHRTANGWRLRLAVWATLAFLVAHHHPLFDADPWMSAVAWSSWGVFALGLALAPRLPLPALAWRLGACLLVLAVVAQALVAPSKATSVAALAWAGMLALAAWLAAGRLARRDAAGLSLVAMPVATFILACGLPALLVDPLRAGATVLDESGYAYDFCEHPERHQLFMTIPHCAASQIDKCPEGYVAEYDSRDVTKRGDHHFFNDRFYGALREMVCLGDRVQVTMNQTSFDGFNYVANVMEFDPDDPSDFEPTIFPYWVIAAQGRDLLGHRAAWDRKRDAVFYVSEWSNTILRHDRASGAMDRDVGLVLPHKEFDVEASFGPFTGPESFGDGGDTLFFTEWISGSRVWQLELDTLRLRSTWETHDTGSFGAAVDEERGALLASGFWGLNVLDLETGAVRARRRLGPGVRVAQIDRHNDLVYVGTTLGGYLWVLDRNDYAPLLRIATGLGARRPHVTHDGRRLFATSQSETFWIDTAEILRALGRSPAPRGE